MPRHRSHTNLFRFAALALFACVVAACSMSTGPDGGTPQALTALPRDLTAAEQEVIAGSNAFSFALWHQLGGAERDSNVFVSPLSASFALGMAMNGAANQTWDEMRTALQFGGASQQEIDEGYRSLIGLLTSLDPGVALQVANSAWYRNTFTFLPSFLEATRTYFGATVQGLDFASPASLTTINGWVDARTNHRIPTILDRIDPRDVMFLVNAIYFKGNWRQKFDAANTTDEAFHAAGGADQPMRLMHKLRDSTYYGETSSYQAVDLPYGNGAFSMTVLLPKEGTDVETLAASLTPAAWDSVVAGLHRFEKVDLYLPRLTLEWGRKLNDDLDALGMHQAFVPGGADFTNLAAAPAGNQLYVSFVKQKTFVAVDEEGTEAAAATAVGITFTAAPPPPPVMRVDHPYIFAIRERFTGTILFMGKIVRMPA